MKTLVHKHIISFQTMGWGWRREAEKQCTLISIYHSEKPAAPSVSVLNWWNAQGRKAPCSSIKHHHTECRSDSLCSHSGPTTTRGWIANLFQALPSQPLSPDPLHPSGQGSTASTTTHRIFFLQGNRRAAHPQQVTIFVLLPLLPLNRVLFGDLGLWLKSYPLARTLISSGSQTLWFWEKIPDCLTGSCFSPMANCWPVSWAVSALLISDVSPQAFYRRAKIQ